MDHDTCLELLSHVSPFIEKHYERQPQTEAIPYGELLHAPSATLTYDGHTANLCLDKSSSGLPWVSVHTADLLCTH